ncbi:hypothetical protein GQ53DRAFT_789162 [Thozetella sp. PMI_491]|nr:hypothetical protein GQ53DRAFT_789162 [Thozetella sp. PMI_491]
MDRQSVSNDLGYPNAGNPWEAKNGRARSETVAPDRGARAGDAHNSFVYLSVMHGIGALIVSGGINFAIAYGMYTTQDTTLHPIRLFELPNTLAGDAAVTIILQCIVTWLIEFVMVTGDLRNGKLAPIGFVAPPNNRFLRWFMFLDAQQKAVKPGRVGHWPLFLAAHALRGFIIAVPSFILLWGPTVGILTAVGARSGGDWEFSNKWAPEIFKLILGGVLGLLATPPMAAFWMMRAGWPVDKTDG